MIRFSIWSLVPSPCRPPMRFASSSSSTSPRNVDAVQRDGMPLLEPDRDGLPRDGDVVAPRGDAHDRFDDRHAAVEALEILRFVRRPQDVGVGRIRLLRAHPVGEAGARHVGRHLGAPAELVDERLIEPRLVDPERRVRQQAVAVEPLDVVPLERAAVAPDVHAVVLHRADQHRAGDGPADRRRVEVRHAGGRDVERAALQRRDPFGDELRAAVDQARLLRAVLQRPSRDVLVVGLVGLPEIGGICVGDRAAGCASNGARRWYRGRPRTRCRPSRRRAGSEGWWPQ